MTHYSTHLNDQPEVPVFKKGAAFLFKYQAVTSESESKVRVFSPFPKIPDVNLTGAEELLSLAKIRITGIGGMYVQKVCEFQEINETYGLLMTQLKDRVELIKLEVKQATDEQGKLADVMKSFLPKQYQRNVATLPRSKRFIGTVAALAAGAGLILGDPLKEAACTAVSIFNLCDDTSRLSQDVDQILKTQEETIATLQRVQSANDENFFLLGNEVRETQQNVKNLRDAVNDHLQVLHDRINGIQGDLIQHKECKRRQAQHSLFLQEIRHTISHLGTLYTHIKSYQAAFYAYKINLFSTISSLASGQITPQFLLPQEIADIVRTLSEEESYCGTKLTPAIQPGFEAVYYEIQLVLEVTLIPRGISVVLGVPMNSKSSTFNVYHATPLYQPNGDNKTASLFQLAKPFLAVATDDSRYAELDSSTLQQCSGNNRIRLCRKGFSTTTDDTLLCLSSLMFDYAIPALRNCPANSVLLPDAPQAFYLAEGLYHVISREPLLHMKNASDIHGVSVSMILCQACILRPSCHSTLTLNQGDLVLEPDMDYCSTSPEPFFAAIELIPSLEQVFKHVPHSNHVFHAYSLGEARHSVLSSVRMELAELPDVRRMSVDSIDQLAHPIAQYYSSISPATSQALESYLPFRTAVLFSTVSITLSSLTFTISFTLFRRQWKRLFLHPHKFFKSTNGRLVHVMDSHGTPDTVIDDASVFIQLSLDEFNALKTLASETLRHPPHNNSYTTCNAPQIPTRVYPDITAPHYSESTT